MVFLFGWEHSIVGPILFCTHKSKTGGALCYDSLVRKERVAAEGGALLRRLDADVIRKVHYWNRKDGSVWAGSLMILLQILTRNRLSDLKQGGT